MANKLDQLFRENLDPLEIKPSAEAWKQVQAGLGKKQYSGRVWSLRIAAAVVLMLSATVVVMNTLEKETQPLLTAVDHPTVKTLPGLEVELAEEGYIAENEQSAVASQIQAEPNSKKEKNELVRQEEVLFEEMPVIQIAALHHSKVEADLVSGKPKLQENNAATEEPYIKITYIASSDRKTSEENTRDENRLNKVISLAKELSSTDVLADIREAKDNFFRRNN